MRVAWMVLVVGACACDQGESESEIALALSVDGVGMGGVAAVCFDLELRSVEATLWSLGDRASTRLGAGQPYVHALGAGEAAEPDESTVCFGPEGRLELTVPCDPSSDTSDEPGIQNALGITLDGAYELGADGVTPARHIRQDDLPCTSGCTAYITCRARATTPVDVQITLGRVVTDRGFFDAVAVLGGEQWCSLKVDSAEILQGDDGERVPTAILGAACASAITEPGRAPLGLELAPVGLTCDGEALSLPMLGSGLQDDGPLRYAIYTGTSLLTGSTHETRYWNFAFDLEQLEGLGQTCRVEHLLTVEVPERRPGRERVLIHPIARLATELTRDGRATHAEGSFERPNGIVHLEYRGDVLELPAMPLLCYRHDGEPRALTERAGCEAAR